MTYPQPYGPQLQAVIMPTPYRSSTAHIVVAWIVAVFTLLYMLPWAVAATRHRPNTATIAVLNLFLGWSLVGWIVALVMSLSSDAPHTTVIVQAQPPSYGPAPQYRAHQAYGPQHAYGPQVPYGPQQQYGPPPPNGPQQLGPTQQPQLGAAAAPVDPTAILPPESNYHPRYDR